MLGLAETRDEISMVSDQISIPTYAGDLADVILKIISSKNTNFGLYHYSNEGQTSWYGFAKAIFEGSNLKIKTTPIKTEAYPTPAKRPKHSVLDTEKVKKAFNIQPPKWEISLKKVIENI
jgi:dTDP-4-dehydrorhamnose reductase